MREQSSGEVLFRYTGLRRELVPGNADRPRIRADRAREVEEVGFVREEEVEQRDEERWLGRLATELADVEAGQIQEAL